MFGFFAKETLLATSLHPTLPPLIGSVFPWAAVVAGALLLAQSALLLYGTFFGKPADPDKTARGHDPRTGMWLAPAIPAVLSLAIGLLPEPERLASFLAGAASDAYGSTVKVSLALWTGLSAPLVLSVLAVGLGSILFLYRRQVRGIMLSLLPDFSLNQLYSFVVTGIDKSAELATRLQNGHLRFYLTMMLASLGGLIVLFSALPVSSLTTQLPGTSYTPVRLDLIRVFSLSLAVLLALVSITIRRDMPAVLALSVAGLAISVWIALEPAPDVALVQIIVDLLATVVLVLSLSRLPRVQRQKAMQLTFRQSRLTLARDAVIAICSGMVVALIVYISLVTRPHASLVTPFYAANAKLLTGAKDIVGAILVDFRGFDTLFEIAVFAIAGLGIHTLLHYAARKAGDREEPDPELPSEGEHPVTGIAGLPTSPLLHLLANALLPLALLLAVTQMMYGHDQPGDGFTAGVFVSLTIGFWYIIFGYHVTKRRLPWLHSGYLIAAGLLLAIFNGLISQFFGVAVLASLDYGKKLNLLLPAGFNLSSAFFYELAIFLTVLGSATYILDNLGRPKEADPEIDALLVSIQEEQRSAAERETS
jgi:multicomponent K+:H+ antiporter subunit A